MRFVRHAVRVSLAQRPSGLLIGFSVLIVAAYLAATVSLSFVLGRGQFWAYPVGPWLDGPGDQLINNDLLNALIGYAGFLHTPLQLPLFHVPTIGAPEGTSVIFLEVLPVSAFVGRVLSQLFGTVILPYGLWFVACFLLSGTLATALLAQAGQRSLLAAFAATIFAISAPPLLHRFGHFDLLGHFLIVGALVLYLREQRPFPRYARAAAWTAWLMLALFTSPYILAMIGAIYAACVARSLRTQAATWRLVEAAMIALALIVTMRLSGFIGPDTSMSGVGFNMFSMNLLSPFWPQRSGIFPQMHAIVDATQGQYEGFNYLGLGGILLVAAACLLRFKTVVTLIARHLELTTAFIALTLFALSTQIYLGDHRIVAYNVGWRLTKAANIFRSSGRMFWPVYYAILLGSLTILLRSRTKPLIAVVACACLIQVADTEPLRARITRLTENPAPRLIDPARWERRIEQADAVEVFPTYPCAASPEQQRIGLEITLAAARAGKPFNSVYNSRRNGACSSEAAQLRHLVRQPGTLYVFLNGHGDEHPPEPTLATATACHPSNIGTWCLDASVAD